LMANMQIHNGSDTWGNRQDIDKKRVM